jgi:hypothetical protein
MPPRKSRLRKREATPEPAEEEQPVDTTSTTVLNAEIEQVVEQPQPERELEPELEREDDAEHDEDADAQKKKKAKASKTPLKAAKSKAQPVVNDDDDDDDAVEHADTHVRDRELDAEFAEPLRAAAVSSAVQNAAPVRPSTRLIIKEMVLENFKSYAGTQLIGPFHKVRLPLSTFLTASFLIFF